MADGCRGRSIRGVGGLRPWLAGLAALAWASLAAAQGGPVLEVTDCGDTGGPGQLRQVIATAPPRATIVIPACRISLAGAAGDDANATGDLDILQSLTIQGAGAGRTVLDGGGVDRVIDVLAGQVTLADLTITGGRVAAGLGGGGVQVAAGTRVLLRRVEVAGNSATGAGQFGGGIVALGEVTLELSMVAGNSAPAGLGGGIASAGPLTVENSTISGNTAARGGAIVLGAGAASPSLRMVQATVSGNRGTGPANGAGGEGGILGAHAGPKHILQSTIADNVSEQGPAGGLASQVPPAFVLRSTIVARNGPAGCGPGAAVSAGHNLQTDPSCGLALPTDLTAPDPGLGPLAAGGGLTLTHALAPGSPAVDRGGQTGCPTVDQRGVRRPRDGDGDGDARCDIGAVERQAPSARRVGGE